ncbi:MAG TPA: DUF6151 family protein [Polyangiales bacterium]|nr:DUF6151 family protein [Polyangiales bacterium]
MRLEIRCRCGIVAGHVQVTEQRRVVCYCDDCQLYARYLNRVDILDAHGGTDAVITAPGHVHLDRGQAFVRCLRLTARGAYRWYASCCNTPLGSTLGAWLPFASLPSTCFASQGRLGPIDARVRARYASSHVPGAQLRVPLMFLLSTLWFVLRQFRARRPSLYPLQPQDPRVVPSEELAPLRAGLPASSVGASPLDSMTVAVLRSCG